MKCMKSTVALALSGAMILSLLAGCASAGDEQTSAVSQETQAARPVENEEATAPETTQEKAAAWEKSYDEKISFSITTYYSLRQASAGHDLESDPYISWVKDKFNVEIDAWACDNSGASEQTRLWVNGGTMPDCMIWTDLTIPEINEYADQELIQPLPEGWEEKWPNLADMISKSGMSELVKVDGATYAIPHAVYGNFNDMEIPVSHVSLHFRKDWAEQVGMEDLGDDYTITLSELREYIEKVAEAGLCENPVLAADTGNIMSMFMIANGVNNESFVKAEDGSYDWGYNQEGYTAALEQADEWIDAGLIDADFYVKDGQTYFNEYIEGLTPCIFYSAGIGNYQKTIDSYMTVEGTDPYDPKQRGPIEESRGLAAICAEDGTVYADGIYSYAWMHTFSPQCDEATMERILDIMDYYCTMEGQASERLAIPGQDFEIDDGGNITVLNENIISGEYQVSPSRYFNVWGYCGDDYAFAMGNPTRFAHDREVVLANYAVKEAGTILPVDDKVTGLATTAMKNYSFDQNAAFAEALNSDDVLGTWEKIKNDNKNIWEPVVADLNQ